MKLNFTLKKFKEEYIMALKFNGQPNWYGYEDVKGFPGMKATSAVDTVESFTAEGEVQPGTFVTRGTDKDKQVKAISSASDVPVGIAVHTHHEPGTVYSDGATVPVIVNGNTYVEVSGAVTAGEPVHINATGKIGGATLADSAVVANTQFMESAADGEIARVRIVK